MQCRVDKRLIELMNEAGANVTWDQFREAYDRRRAERDSDPERAEKLRRRITAEDRAAALEKRFG